MAKAEAFGMSRTKALAAWDAGTQEKTNANE